MFGYTDPVLTGILQSENALNIFRDILDTYYDTTARPDNRFEKLERIPPTSPTTTIEWPAFPITANQSDQVIDQNRFILQDEYVEWRVEHDANGDISFITFSTEFPEYYEALAEVSEQALVAGIQDAIPGANPTTDELFGSGFDPATASSSQRADAFRSQNVIPFGSGNQTVPNPWNNNAKGILCLGQQFNTLGALFNLARHCSVPNPGIPSTGQCAAVGGACGPNRNSDPQICTTAQDVARIPRALSLQDPVGVVMLRLRGSWRIGNNQIDINDPNNNGGVWTITRNGRRGQMRIVDGLTVDNDSVISGAQISRLLDVGAVVISATPNELLSVVAGARGFSRSMPELSRSPQ